jgi:hypothetical protein
MEGGHLYSFVLEFLLLSIRPLTLIRWTIFTICFSDFLSQIIPSACTLALSLFTASSRPPYLDVFRERDAAWKEEEKEGYGGRVPA